MPLERGDVIVMQQILAHPSGVLSQNELAARNPDVSGDALQSRVGCLTDRGLVTRIDSHFAVTVSGIEELEHSNLFDEIAVWSGVYSVVDDCDESGDRPSPDWYADYW